MKSLVKISSVNGCDFSRLSRLCMKLLPEMCNGGLQRPLDEVIIGVAPDRASGIPDFKGFPYNTNSAQHECSFGGHLAASPQNFPEFTSLTFR